MIVTCKQCDTRFKLDSARIKPTGTKVRCSGCANVFRVYPSSDGTDSPASAPGSPGRAAPGAAREETGTAAAGLPPAPAPAEMSAGGGEKREAFDFGETTAGPGWAPSVMGEDRPYQAGVSAEAEETVPFVRATDEPVMLDLETLEIGPEVGDVEETAFDFEVDTGIAEVSGEPAAEPASETDLALAVDDADSFDMEDILQSLEIEDAPVEEELPDVDIESFDLLADNGAADRDPAVTAAVSPEPGTLEDLDPAEIEALLDLEGAGDDAQRKEASAGAVGDTEAGIALERQTAQSTAADPSPEAAQADGAGEGPDLNLDQLEEMIAGEEAFLMSASNAKGARRPDGYEGLAADPEAEATVPLKDDGDPVDGIDLADIELLLDREIAAEKPDQGAFGAGAAADPTGPDEDFDHGATQDPDLSLAEDIELSLDFQPGEDPDALPPGDSATPGKAFNLPGREGVIAEGQADMEDDPSAAGAQVAPGDEGALDFSDIEKMLEEEVDAPDSAEEDENLELVLDFPMPGEYPKAGTEAGEKAAAREEELLEDAVAELDASSVKDVSDTEVFDLDFDLEDIPQEFGGASVILEGEDGLEIETLGSLDENEPLPGGSAVPRRVGGRPGADLDSRPFEMGGVDDDEIPAETMVGAAVVPAAARSGSRRPRKTRKFFWVLLILVLLGAGGYAAIDYFGVDVKDIRLPAIERFFKKEPADGGALSLSLTDVGNRFVNNANVGILFVITGRARNGYDHPRSYLEVKGVLNARDGRPLQTMTAYCGNTLSDGDLAGLDMAAIRMRLNNRAGANRSNLNVPPNRSVPFMLVFADLPPDLGEFSVEPAASAPAN